MNVVVSFCWGIEEHFKELLKWLIMNPAFENILSMSLNGLISIVTSSVIHFALLSGQEPQTKLKKEFSMVLWLATCVEGWYSFLWIRLRCSRRFEVPLRINQFFTTQFTSNFTVILLVELPNIWSTCRGTESHFYSIHILTILIIIN